MMPNGPGKGTSVARCPPRRPGRSTWADDAVPGTAVAAEAGPVTPPAVGRCHWRRPLGGRARRSALRFDQDCCRGQPERGEQEAAEDVGRVMLAPVHAGQGHQDGHGDRGDEEQPSPPAAGVPDDQDRDGDVEAARGGLVPGRVRRGGQVPVELRDVRPGPVDHGRGDEEDSELAGHDRGDEDDRPPAPGDGEEHHAGGERDDEDRLGRPEGAEDLAPVGQAGRAVGGEPVRDRPVA